jgi:hypothetical protein
VATLTEATVQVALVAERDDAGTPRLFARATSFDASGTAIRHDREEVTAILTGPQAAGLAAIFAAVEAATRARWQIP